MDVELIQSVIYLVIDSFALLGAVLLTLLFALLIKKGIGSQRRPLLITFGLMTLAQWCNVIAEFWWDYLEYQGIDPNYGIPDVFWSIAKVTFLFAFTYFLFHLVEKRGDLRKYVTYSSMGLLSVLLITAMLFSAVIFPYLADFGLVELLLNYFYPLAGAAIAFACVNLYHFFSQEHPFKNAFLLLALAFLVTVIADIVFILGYQYETYLPYEGLGDMFFALEYILISLAVALLLHSWARFSLRPKHS